MTTTIHERILAARDRADRAVDFCRKAAGMVGLTRNVIAEAGAGDSRENLGQYAEQYRYFTGWQYVAISAIARKIAGQTVYVSRKPPKVSRRTKAISDPLEPLPDHPLLDALADPNPLMVPYSLIYSTVASLEITGRAFWWFLRDGDRWQIWPLPASWVEPADKLRTSWLVRLPGSVEPIPQPRELIALFSLPDPSNPFGSVSPLQTQAQAVVADSTLQSAQNKAIHHGVFPSVILKAGRTKDQNGRANGPRPNLTQEQRKQLIDSILKAYGGFQNHSRQPFIVDGLIDEIVPWSRTPKELDFLDSGRALKSRIFQAFGVNPIVVGEIENANRAQAAVAQAAVAENVINPLIELLSQTLTKWVAPLFARPAEQLVVWIDPTRANDPEQTLAEWSLASARGFVTGNEYRRVILGLPELPGLDEPTQSTTPPAPAASVPKSLAGLLDPYTLKPFGRGSNGDGDKDD